MDCKKARSLISDYIDGDLSFNSLTSFSEHIAQCSSCKEELVDTIRSCHALRRYGHSLLPIEEDGRKEFWSVVKEIARNHITSRIADIVQGVYYNFPVN